MFDEGQRVASKTTMEGISPKKWQTYLKLEGYPRPFMRSDIVKV
jgi:hypothetical protein